MQKISSLLKSVKGLAVATTLVAGTIHANANALLFDFGAAATQTTGGQTADPVYWNNVPASLGAVDDASLLGLVLTNGAPTDITFQMVSRFNGANENGTTAFAQYPASATRDSLFGNTELFSGLENITPIFKLVGLDAAKTYTFTFYASRTGVTDNRETRYTITGASELTRDLNVANNVSTTVATTAVAPDANNEITIALTPGPNNNNGNHFVYVGVLQVDVSDGGRLLIDFGADSSLTDATNPTPSAFWNNITETIGTDNAGSLAGLVDTNGVATAANFQMTSRFNGANTAGVTTSTNFPATATQDSLFGNTEAFNGLSNIKPVFKLTGLDPNFIYSFTFFASRNGVTDNRETRYTVKGATTSFADLNTSNNTNNLVTVSDIRPTEAGEIEIALTPTANNNNANHFTYIGAMRVDLRPFREPRLLVDFGAPGRPTTATSDPDNAWNNVTTVVGSTDTNALTNLVLTDGIATTINLQMVSRFNGVNENGTEFSTLYSLDATRDSLYGNTEIFSGLENITPIFKLTGLKTTNQYDFTFYASRMNVGDNRETRYTVTGTTSTNVDLNVANNEDGVAVVTDIVPTGAGEITIALTPGPNNDNGNHFVYLGVLQVDWLPAPGAPTQPSLSQAAYVNGNFTFTLTGVAGSTYKIQRSTNLIDWTDATTVTLTSASQSVTIPQADAYQFYRAVLQ